MTNCDWEFLVVGLAAGERISEIGGRR